MTIGHAASGVDGPTALRPDEATALRLDADDPLTALRDRFELPIGLDGEPLIYLCGHSLGVMPRGVRKVMDEELDTWSRMALGGHFRDDVPWLTYAQALAEPTARIVGALPSEVVTMNGLSVNIHLLLSSFYRRRPGRDRILMEAGAFPSDRYAVDSHLRLRGIDPANAVMLVRPRSGEDVPRTEDIVARIEEEGERLALVWLPGIQYLTGQRLDINRITAAAHEQGALAGWDLAHAAGNVPLYLHDDDVDVAAWCTYKYLNSGPGGVGQAFIHERFADDASIPRLAGWWGNDPAVRFEMTESFEPARGADGWQLTNPPILALAPLRASLELFGEVGIHALRERSVRLTAYLLEALDASGVGTLITPRDPEARGAQLSVRLGAHARDVETALAARGAMVDFRAPDVIRFAPAPLYNTFHEAWRFVELLRSVVDSIG